MSFQKENVSSLLAQSPCHSKNVDMHANYICVSHDHNNSVLGAELLMKPEFIRYIEFLSIGDIKEIN